MTVDELVDWARSLPTHECDANVNRNWILCCSVCGQPQLNLRPDASVAYGQMVGLGFIRP